MESKQRSICKPHAFVNRSFGDLRVCEEAFRESTLKLGASAARTNATLPSDNNSSGFMATLRVRRLYNMALEGSLACSC